MTKWNDTQYKFLEPQMPYECKQCGHGSMSDNYCRFCDDGVLRYAWRRGGLQTFIPSLAFIMLWMITDVPLFIAPFGLLILWNLYLLVTAKERMKKHFIKRDPRRN